MYFSYFCAHDIFVFSTFIPQHYDVDFYLFIITNHNFFPIILIIFFDLLIVLLLIALNTIIYY